MFTIIISEKGGAERRETFDKNEINVGRVQGNDLMLPKGNVSKHHARLLFRDGRFIVTDLKSTNGTYVNGRKIAQATIVREGDKIYVGDFILRVDLGGAGAAAGDDGQAHDASAQAPQTPMGQPPPPAPMPQPPGMPQPPMVGAPPPGMPPLPPQPMPPAPMPAPPKPMMQPGPPMPQAPVPAQNMMSPQPPQAQQGRPGFPAGMPPLPQPVTGQPMQPPGFSPPQAQQPPAMMTHPAPPMGMPQPQPGLRAPDPSAVSHYPLERDPDESEPAQQRMPAPARVPQVANQPTRGGTLAISGGAARPPSMPPTPAPAQISAAPRASSPGSTPSRLPPRESPVAAGRRLALSTLVDRVADAVDLSPLKASPVVTPGLASNIETAVVEQLKAMKEEEGIPEGVDGEVLRADAVRELTGLGAIGPLLDDDDVLEVHCLRHDQVLVVRGGGTALADATYSSDRALRWTILRLAEQTGDAPKAGESILDRRTAKGAHVMAFLPPASTAHALVIRKRRKVEMSLEDFVRLSAMSRSMATFLEGCLAARANILVCGSTSAASTTFLGGLASSGSPGDRVAVLQDEEEFVISHAQVLRASVAAEGTSPEELVRAAARIRPERLIVGAFTGRFVAATLEAIAEGTEGVLAAASAPSLRHALSRLTGQLLLARPGLGADAARELVGEAFDVAIEVHMLPDGRYRVTRIAELGGTDAKGIVARDIFVAAAEGGGEGHVATGVVPRIVNEFAARGVRVDTNLFKKSR